jgi:predicted TIM-barrel fold metal-dependent hydrolase
MVIDRLEREREYGELRCEKPIVEYFNNGRFYVGCEGNESVLSYVIDRIGPQACMFASDFPHEIPLENALHEINEILERKDLYEAHKKMILGDNAKQFYKI